MAGLTPHPPAAAAPAPHPPRPLQPGRFGKINSKLAFPERLDLGPYMAAGCVDGDPALYSLYAVVVHIDWGRSTDYGALGLRGRGQQHGRGGAAERPLAPRSLRGGSNRMQCSRLLRSPRATRP